MTSYIHSNERTNCYMYALALFVIPIWDVNLSLSHPQVQRAPNIEYGLIVC
jgi:hypothetical protein